MDVTWWDEYGPRFAQALVYVAVFLRPHRCLLQGHEFMDFVVMLGRPSPVGEKFLYVARPFSSAGHDRRPIFDEDFFSGADK